MVDKVYKGELEKLQEEYLKRKELDDRIANKRKAIMEEQRDMMRRQAEKDKLKKEVKALRFKQSRTGQTINAVKDVTKRSWNITKNVGHGLSVAGGSIMGALGGNSPQPARNVPIRQTAKPRMIVQQPMQPTFNAENFENQLLGGAMPFGSQTQRVPRVQRIRRIPRIKKAPTPKPFNIDDVLKGMPS